MGSDTLPLAISFHPRIGKPIGVRECFSGLGLAHFFRDAGHDRDVRPEHPHRHLSRSSGRIGVGVALSFREQRRFIAGLSARRSTDEIVSHDLLDRRGIVRC